MISSRERRKVLPQGEIASDFPNLTTGVIGVSCHDCKYSTPTPWFALLGLPGSFFVSRRAAYIEVAGVKRWRAWTWAATRLIIAFRNNVYDNIEKYGTHDNFKGSKAAKKVVANNTYDDFLRWMEEAEQANRDGKSARDFAKSKGVPSSLSDEEAKALNQNNERMSFEGGGETTLANWIEKMGELAKTSPIKIPENATVKPATKAAGYEQISYKWSDETYKYEVRWHTKTPGAPAGQGNTWVVSRVTRGTATGQISVEHILAGDKWVTRYEWQQAITAYQNRTMTAAQEAMLKAGHWLAP